MRATRFAFVGGSLLVLVGGASALPYLFPTQDLVSGASSEVGFNNWVSYLWYALFLVIPSVLVARLPAFRAIPTSDWPRPRFPRSWIVVAFVCAAHVLVFVSVYLYRGRFVFGEALYFQAPLYRMTLGDVPYLDFSFYYGPSMLYPAFLLSRLLGLEAGYGVWFVLTYVAGLVMLYAVLCAFVSERRATMWFLLLAAGLFNPWTGLNDTFARFMLPFAAVTATHAYLSSGGRVRWALAQILITASLTYTFEAAALAVVGAVVLLLLTASLRLRALLARVARLLVAEARVSDVDFEPRPAGDRASGIRGAALLGLAFVLSAGLFLLIDRSGRALAAYPGAALSFLEGAYNSPVYPNLAFLAVAGITVFAFAGVVRHFALAPDGFTAALAAFFAVAVAGQRAAFAEPDPSHFSYYCVPVLAVALLVTEAAPWGATARRVLLVAVLVGIVLPLQTYQASQFAPFFQVQTGDAAAPRAQAQPRSQAVEASITKAVLAVGVDRPYLMYRIDYYSYWVYRKLGLRYSTYDTFLLDSRTLARINKVIDEISASRAYVLILSDDLIGAPIPPSRSGVLQAWGLISGANLPGSPLRTVIARNEARLFEPLLNFLRVNYRKVYAEDGIVILRPPD